MQQIGLFVAKLTVCSTCFGHHYAHHQELKSYTDGCCPWYLVLWFTGRWSGVELWVMCPVCGMFLDCQNFKETKTKSSHKEWGFFMDNGVVTDNVIDTSISHNIGSKLPDKVTFTVT